MRTDYLLTITEPGGSRTSLHATLDLAKARVPWPTRWDGDRAGSWWTATPGPEGETATVVALGVEGT